MPLAPGTIFGAHEIAGLLGAGGMGELYHREGVLYRGGRRVYDLRHPGYHAGGHVMRLSPLVAAAAAGLLAASTLPARAHHSFGAAFDADKPVTVEGTIAEVRLENPHSWFFVTVTQPDGQVVRWAFEGSTPTSLIRSGYRPNLLKVGDKVTVKGVRSRDLSQNAGAAREIVTADGRSFIVGPAGNGSTPER
jgi:hypothetical protein